MARFSLRLRLLVLALLLVATGLVVSDTLVIGAVQSQLVDRTDQQLARFGEPLSRRVPGRLGQGQAQEQGRGPSASPSPGQTPRPAATARAPGRDRAARGGSTSSCPASTSSSTSRPMARCSRCCASRCPTPTRRPT
ncbi:hypothetical protein [Kitasatospora paranensis]|uniref:hypothetical protein n=1 Tax=Kitasatospora paranensis TaxID=258053 RepID=UPI0031E6E499